VKWAMVGASDIAATKVLPALRACDQDVHVVYSSDADRGRSFANEHGIPLSTTSLDEALAGVSAAYVSSTNEKHHQQTTAALDRGIHVLCEKPLALTVEDARSMVEAAVANACVLATNHHLRNNPALLALRDGLAAGQIGDLLSVRVDHAVLLPERLRGWRLSDRTAGGGVVLDLTVHDIDVIRFVTGLEPTRITAVAVSQLLGAGVPDAVMTAGHLGETTLFSTHDAFTVANNTTSVVVHGTEGTYEARDCLTPEPRGTLNLIQGAATVPVPLTHTDDVYVPTIRAFADAAAGLGHVRASGLDGLMSLTTALAAQASIDERRTVDIPRTARLAERQTQKENS
jgi:1,5-anhydro-D-fructose reductase (1,5-anhydro-D-mannitol-forming)